MFDVREYPEKPKEVRSSTEKPEAVKNPGNMESS